MTPALWIIAMRKIFGCTDRLSHDLWRVYPVTSTLLFQLARCGDLDVNDEAIIVARFERLSELVTPSALIESSLQIAPETGKPRSRQHVAFEEKVMRKTDACGRWK